MTTWEFKDLKDLPVVSNATAREIGRVHEVLFDPAANALFGLVVSQPEKNSPPLFVLLKEIRAIGKDAITVAGLNIEPFEENVQAKAISAAGGHRDGMNVMTESGESVGKVDKVTLNEDGTVASYHSTTGFFGTKHDIEPSEIVSGSEEKLIISDSAREGAARTVMAGGRNTGRAPDPDPTTSSIQPVPASSAKSNGAVLKANEEASESPVREVSQSVPASRGTPDNSMFTSNEIPSREAPESPVR
jgi:uncharacterized protein YrrD